MEDKPRKPTKKQIAKCVASNLKSNQSNKIKFRDLVEVGGDIYLASAIGTTSQLGVSGERFSLIGLTSFPGNFRAGNSTREELEKYCAPDNLAHRVICSFDSNPKAVEIFRRGIKKQIVKELEKLDNE